MNYDKSKTIRNMNHNVTPSKFKLRYVSPFLDPMVLGQIWASQLMDRIWVRVQWSYTCIWPTGPFIFLEIKMNYILKQNPRITVRIVYCRFHALSFTLSYFPHPRLPSFLQAPPTRWLPIGRPLLKHEAPSGLLIHVCCCRVGPYLGNSITDTRVIVG